MKEESDKSVNLTERNEDYSAIPKNNSESEVLGEVHKAIEDLQALGVDPSLRRVIHRLFERSVNEFYKDDYATSMQLPEDLLHYTVPDPAGTPLPEPTDMPQITLESAFNTRRSERSYKNSPVTLADLSGLLHEAIESNNFKNGYGVRNIPQHPYPNIGGLDPVEIGVMALNVENLKPGYYVYDKVGHGLIPTIDGNMRLALIDASFENDWMFYAPVVLVISLNTEKVEWKYKTRGYRLAHIDIGAAMENIYLACMAYNLSCCAVAGYNDEKINKLLHYYPSCDKAVGVLIPIGYSPAAN